MLQIIFCLLNIFTKLFIPTCHHTDLPSAFYNHHSSVIGSCFHIFRVSAPWQCNWAGLGALPWRSPLIKSSCSTASSRLWCLPSAAGDRAGDGRVHRRRPDVWSDGGVQQAAGSRLHPARREKPRLLHRNVLGAGHPELTPECKYRTDRTQRSHRRARVQTL